MDKVTQYVRNMAKSTKLATVDVLKKYNPSVTEFAESNSDLFREINYMIKDRRQVIKRVGDTFRKSKVYEAADVGFQSVLHSIRTGDFYNTANSEAINKRAMGMQDDFDMDSFSIDSGDFDSSDDFGDFGDFDIDDDSEPSITEGDTFISNSINTSSQANASAICSAIAETGRYTVESSRINSQIISMQNMQAFGTMNTSLSNINSNINQMTSLVSGMFEAHANNSKTYYEKSLDYQQQTAGYLKELVEMERNRYANELKEDQKSSKIGYGDIVSGGIPDLKVYGQSIKKRAKTALSNSGLDIAGLFGDDSNALLAFAAQPLAFLPQKVIEKLVGNTVKNSMDMFNKSMESFFGAAMLRVNTLSKQDNDNPLIDWLNKNILPIFGVENSLKTQFETKNYNKGNMQWNGVANKALTEVIPTYLRKILSALTNTEETSFDYDTGKFVKTSSVKRKFKNLQIDAARDASSGVTEEINKKVNKQVKFTDKDQKDKFQNDMKEMFQYFFDNGIMFDPRRKTKDDYDLINVSDSNYKIVSEYFKTLPKYMQLEYSKNILEGRSNVTKNIEKMEGNPNSIYNVLGNEDTIDEFITKFSESNTVKSQGIFKDSIMVEDNYGHSMHYYLHQIYGTLLDGIKTYNLNGSGYGGGGSKGGRYSKDVDKILNRDTKISNTSGESYYSKKRRQEDSASRSFSNRSKDQNEKDIKKGIYKTSYEELSGLEGTDSGRSIEGVIQNNISIEKAIEEGTKRANSTNTKFKNTLDKSKAYYEKHPEEAGSSIIGKLLQADSLVDKFKIFGDKLEDLTKAPAKIVSGVIDQVDTRLYEVIFGVENQTYKGKPVKGVLDVMIINMQETFTRVNDWLDERILQPLKDKLDKRGGWSGLLDEFLAPFGLTTDDINIFKKGKNYLFGDSQNGTDGIFTPVMEQLKDDIKGIFNYSKDTMTEVYAPVIKLVKENTPEWLKRKPKEEDDEFDKFKTPHVSLNAKIEKTATEQGIDTKDPSSREFLDKTIKGVYATGTKFVPRDMFAHLDKGERVLTPDENVKFQNILSMMDSSKIPGFDMDRYLNKDKSNMDNQFSMFTEAHKNDGLSRREIVNNRYNEKLANGEKITLIDDIGKTLVNDLSTTVSILFGKKKGQKDESHEKDLNSNFNKAVDDLTSNYKEYAPKAVSGAIIGAGISIIPGIIGGPLLGAATGAGYALLKNSSKLQNYLFGDLGEDGERKGGLVSKETQKVMNKYLPDLKKLGLAGAITGLMTPLGPIGGLMVGSSLAYLKNNDRMKEALFGDDGLISPDRKDKIKKAMPNIAMGTIATLVGGPFGLMGNAALGAGLGLVSTTDTFRETIFGIKDEDGSYEGGLLGTIREDVIDPLKEVGKSIRDSILGFIENDMIKPMASAIQPISTEIGHYIKGAIGFIPKMLNKVSEKFIGDPINIWIKEKILDPATSFAKGFFSKMVNPVKFVASLPFKTIGAVGNSFRQRQIMQGRADYMSAEQRIQFRKEHSLRNKLAKNRVPGAAGFMTSDSYSEDDETLSNLSLDQAREALDSLKGIKGDSTHLDKETKKAQRKMYTEVNKYFNDKDKHKIPFLNRGARQNILKAINTGDVETAKHLIKTSRGKNGALLSKEDRDALLEIVNNQGTHLADLQRRRQKVKGLTNEDLQNKLSKLGLTKVNSKNMDKYINLLDSEVRYKSKNSIVDGDGEGTSGINSVTDQAIVENGNQIIKVLRDIRNTMQGNPTIEDEPIGPTVSEKKENETAQAILGLEKKTEDASNVFIDEYGKSKIDANDKSGGFIEDSITRARKEGQAKEEEERQGRLSFFSKFSNFFKGDKEGEKKSLLSTIIDTIMEHPVATGILAVLSGLLLNMDKFAGLSDIIGNYFNGGGSGRTDENGNLIANSDAKEAVVKAGITYVPQVLTGIKNKATTIIDKATGFKNAAINKVTKIKSKLTGKTVEEINKEAADKASKKVAKETTEEVTESISEKAAKTAMKESGSFDDLLMASKNKTINAIIKQLDNFISKFTSLFSSIPAFKNVSVSKIAGTMSKIKDALKDPKIAGVVLKKTGEGAVKLLNAANILLPIWNATTGSSKSETANLFNIRQDDVTAGMRAISGGCKALLGFGFGPILDIINDISTYATGVDYMHYIAISLYRLIADTEGEAALAQSEASFNMDYEIYKTEHDLPGLTKDAYNDMENDTVWSRALKGINKFKENPKEVIKNGATAVKEFFTGNETKKNLIGRVSDTLKNKTYVNYTRVTQTKDGQFVLDDGTILNPSEVTTDQNGVSVLNTEIENIPRDQNGNFTNKRSGSLAKTIRGAEIVGNAIGKGAKWIGNRASLGVFDDNNIRKNLGLNDNVKVNFKDRAVMGTSQLIENLTFGKVSTEDSAKLINGFVLTMNTKIGGIIEKEAKEWKEDWTEISTKTSEAYSKLKSDISTGMNLVNEKFGSVLGMKDKDGNPLSLTEGIKNDFIDVKTALGTQWSKLDSSVDEFIQGMSETISKNFNILKTNVTKGFTFMDQKFGGWFGIKDKDNKPTTLSNGIKLGVSGLVEGFNKEWDKAAKLVTDTLDSVTNFGKNLLNNIKEWIKNKVDSLLKTSEEDTDGRNARVNSKTNLSTGRGKTRLSGFGKVYSQNNPMWADESYNNPNDTIKQTIRNSGCAPMSSSIFMKAITGQDVNPMDAAQYAINNGYKDQNGGTQVDFFGDYLGSKGIKTNSMAVNATNKDAIVQNLKNNTPMILLGQSSNNDTFSPQGHYVVAQGADNNSAFINDPTSSKEIEKTNISKLLSQAKYAVYPTETAGFGDVYMKDIAGVVNKNPYDIETQQLSLKDLRSVFEGLSEAFNPASSSNGINMYTGEIADTGDMKNRKLTSYRNNISVTELDRWIASYARKDSPFIGQGDLFLRAAKESGLDPKYIIAHAATESAWGTSKIARDKGNYFGIGAFNDSPYLSSKYMGSTMAAGIVEGAKWIKQNYTDKGQDTLYKMIYANPTHRYAVTDDGKPNDQWMKTIASIMQSGANAGLGRSGFGDMSLGSINKIVSSNPYDINPASNVKDVYGLLSELKALEQPKIDIGNTGTISGTQTSGPDGNSIDNFFLSQNGFTRKSSNYGPRSGGYHYGVDYAGNAGTPIVSPISGIVTTNNYHYSYGYYVVVQDKHGYLHYFAHLQKKSSLKLNDKVQYGKTIIGYVGNTGESTGNHLHYEVRKPDKTRGTEPSNYMTNYYKNNKSSGYGKSPQIGIPVYNSKTKEFDFGKEFIKTSRSNIQRPTYEYKQPIRSGSGTSTGSIVALQQSAKSIQSSASSNDMTTILKMIQTIIELLIQIVTNTESTSEIVNILSKGLNINIPEEQVANVKNSSNVKQSAIDLLKSSLLVGSMAGNNNKNTSNTSSSLYSNMIKLATE